MVTMPADRPPSPVQLQIVDHPEIGSTTFSNYSQELFGRPASTLAPTRNGFNFTPASVTNGQSTSNSTSQIRADFWRLNRNCHRSRAGKRSSVENPNNDESCPSRKVRLTEEKMLARLRNFHITSAPDNVDSNWFFMQKPMEQFDDMESRMSDEEDEDGRSRSSGNADHDEDQDVLSERNALLLSDVLKRLLDEDHKRVAAVPLPTNPCTDVVLWKPPGDFVKEIVPSLTGTEESNLPRGDSPRVQFNEDHASCGINGVDDRDLIESILRRRNARQFSKPIIEALCVSSQVDCANGKTSDLRQEFMDIDD